MYKASQIADFFLRRYASNGNITPMKLIKLVYIAHGWHLGLTDLPLIGETPEAWKYGPVIPSLYQTFKQFKNSPIKYDDQPEFSIGDNSIDSFLAKIWEIYGRFDGTQLSAKTHMPDTPWYKAWNNIRNDRDISSLQISNIDIRDHYRKLAGKDGQ